MTKEVDSQVSWKLKFVLTGVSHSHVHAEEVIETAAALCQFLRIHEQRDGEVVSGHRPAVASVIAAFERATGRASGPAQGGQLLFFRRVAQRRRQNRAVQNRANRSEERREENKCRSR